MQLIQNENSVILEGNLQVEDVEKMKAFLEQSRILNWNCRELEIEDAQAMASLTSLIKKLLTEGNSITLLAPPQLLMHNLYRLGFYPHPLLKVVEIRQEEVYSS
ncbi:MAG: hypothetical protein RML72_02625 [Bacteroidia bacterium]|nr:hypothetical protein [Bacteroidia bacterium]MDW8157755.1 hypothetical protein [Bacteroidia bacterium]